MNFCASALRASLPREVLNIYYSFRLTAIFLLQRDLQPRAMLFSSNNSLLFSVSSYPKNRYLERTRVFFLFGWNPACDKSSFVYNLSDSRWNDGIDRCTSDSGFLVGEGPCNEMTRHPKLGDTGWAFPRLCRRSGRSCQRPNWPSCLEPPCFNFYRTVS